MNRHLAALAVVPLLGLLLGLAPAPATAQEQAPGTSQRANGEAAVQRLGDRLPEVARRHGMTAERLRATFRSDSTLHVDRDDALLYLDEAVPLTASSEPVAEGAFPYSSTFRLHSRPGASRTLHLDFDGHVVSGTAWNANGVSTSRQPSYDSDGSPTTFSTAEQDVVQDVWQRVAEDYALFDVDVTTEEPPADALLRSGSSDTVFGTRVLITPSAQAHQATCGSTCGGVAYVGVFDQTSNHDYYQPAWVFSQTMYDEPKYLAEAASHEAGHNLGLNHDGTSSQAYYSGNQTWAPIMGASYAAPLSTWSIGSYAGANNREDDLVVAQANGAPLRADDHGGTLSTATGLGSAGGFTALGTVTGRTDVDLFRIDRSCAGPATIAVTPAVRGADLDVRLRLLSSTGGVLAQDDPDSAAFAFDEAVGLDALISTSLGAGTYYLEVDGVGARDPLTTGYDDYGSLGDYQLVGQACTPKPVFTLSGPSSLSEGQSGQYTVTRSGDTSAASRITVQLVAGTATLGTDVVDATQELAFDAGQTTATLPIVTVDDAVAENAEKFTVKLVVPSGVSASLGTPSSVATTITDTDPRPIFTITATTSLVEGGTALATVTRGGDTAVPTRVKATVTGSTATAGSDFSDTTREISFAAGQTTATLEIPTVDDGLAENAEKLSTRLSLPTGIVATLGTPSSATTTLTDNDPRPIFTITATTSLVEGGTAVATVTRGGDTAVATRVKATVTGSTATAGSDFTDTTREISFAAGQTTATLDVPTTDDAVPELAEKLTVKLSIPIGVVAGVGTPGSATVTLTDNDPKPVFTVTGTTSVVEGSAAVVTITRGGDTTVASRVRLQLVSGTAALGADLLDQSQEVAFAAGQTAVTVTLTTVDDTAVEPTEKFTSRLVVPAGVVAVLGSPSSASTSITDDD